MDEHYSSGPGMGTDTAEMDLELMRHMRWCSHLLYHRHNLNFSTPVRITHRRAGARSRHNLNYSTLVRITYRRAGARSRPNLPI